MLTDNYILLHSLNVGVLKRNTVQFEPCLPEWKLDSIKTIGFGLMNKVALLFDEVFWPNNVEVFDYNYSSSSQEPHIPEFFNLDFYTGTKTLVAYSVGRDAWQLENETDEEITSRTLGVIDKIFPHGAPHVPSKVVITRWGSDPYSFGSYSSLPCFCKPKHLKQMATPIEEKLFFAGEHTSLTQFATVHGAYLSGIRAANEVLSTRSKRTESFLHQRSNSNEVLPGDEGRC